MRFVKNAKHINCNYDIEFDIVMQVFYVMVEVIFHMVNDLLILRKHHASIFFSNTWFWLISYHYYLASVYAIFKPKLGVISIPYMANVGYLAMRLATA